MKVLNSIQQELNSLMRLHHTNLVHYLAMKYQKEYGKITVFLLMEYCAGWSLETQIKKNKPLPMDMVKSFAEEILQVLDYLHSKDVVHKHLHPSCVFVDSTGKIRVSEYSLHKRICDLYQLVESNRPGVQFQINQSSIVTKPGKKADIYQLGLLLLSMALATPMDLLNHAPEIPTVFIDVFSDFLTKCLLQDDRHRWSVQQLLDHPFIKLKLPSIPYSSPLKHDGKDVDKEEKPNEEDIEEEIEAPFITAFEASGQSRLTNEFEILRSLGKGGFGDVIKVKNKLDDRLYAIKRIPLNPKSKIFNKKITKEVKLLSRLNHENIVRYYNSWIETSEDPAESDSSSSYMSSASPSNNCDKLRVKPLPSPPPGLYQNQLKQFDDIEKFAPSALEESVEWSISLDANRTQTESDSDDEDIIDVFGTSIFQQNDSTSDIVFEHSVDDMFEIEASSVSFSASKKNSKDTDKQGDMTDDDSVIPRLQYLYIQMEYCEKSTLRNCIDAGLYQDVDRAWRLFREICEGLLHIHEQGMIHRDLKPVNIFLDSNDQVKIGDFGLATTSIMNVKHSNTMFDVSLLTGSHGDSIGSMSGEGNLTGKVGTALYVSPEMMTGESKIIYSQKVDIYSLGIIFFEMCYKPLSTGMERVQILGNIRQPEILFPEDIDQIQLEKQLQIMKWLLNHDPSKRPTSQELLQSPYLPPPQLEEAELNEVLRSTLSCTNSKAYRRMITQLLNQEINLQDEILYDSDYHKSLMLKMPLIQQYVRSSLQKIFNKHGAVPLGTPLLMPRCSIYKDNDTYSCLMDHSGQPVGIPYDLRVPFARYISRAGVQHLKRYCIDRIYREKKTFIQHPKELTECAFDIVTPSQGSLIPDAELLVLTQDVINEFPSLQAKNYYVKINHISILHSFLIYCDIPEAQRNSVLEILMKSKIGHQNKFLIKTLSGLDLTDASIYKLISRLEIEGPFNRVAGELSCILKSKGLAASLAKRGLHEIEAVLLHAATMGLKLPVVVCAGFVYNTHQYSGVIFQVTCDHMIRKSRTVMPDPIATGGRYDSLIKNFAPPLSALGPPSAVGASIAFEKIVNALAEDKKFVPPNAYDVLVCTIGQVMFTVVKETMKVVGDLWAAGLRADLMLETPHSLDEIQEHCRSSGIQHLVILNVKDFVKVRTIEKDRINEKKVSRSELVSYLQPKNKMEIYEQREPIEPVQSNTSTYTRYNFTYVIETGKYPANVRRKYESQMIAKINSSLPWLQCKVLECIYVELNLSALKVLAAYLELSSTEKDFEESTSAVMERLVRHRKYLCKITDHLFNLKFEQKCDVMVLYGGKDDSLRLLT